ncbi:hypothetical protein BX600DRAFT_553174 [Xylariales sp. PMI_506]|nr:hypothetical protein BX600DRAFT_553174 [Xylariales sp. PMI_506]
MPFPISLTAIITPNPGKEKKFLELFDKCAKYAKENEPFVWVYELSKGRVDQNGNISDFVIREVYESEALMQKHLSSAPVQALIKAMSEDGLAKESKVIYTERKGDIGYARL